jgi:acyl carrier protein
MHVTVQHEDVATVMASVLDVPSTEVLEGGTPKTISSWSSLRHLELMMVLEARFGVVIPAQVFPQLLSFRAICAYLQGAAVPAMALEHA